MEKSFVCIECPRGCDLTVVKNGDEVLVTGNFCARGKKYAETEVTCPRRVVTSTVRGEFGMLPVKTDKEIRKELIFSVMQKVRALRIDRPFAIGDVVKENIDGEGTNLVAAANYSGEEEKV